MMGEKGQGSIVMLALIGLILLGVLYISMEDPLKFTKEGLTSKEPMVTVACWVLLVVGCILILILALRGKGPSTSAV